MRYVDFINEVQKVSGIESSGEAMRVTEAILETFGERLTRTERGKLAAQLPNELKEFLFKRQSTERLTLEEFYERVSARADAHLHSGVQMAKAVMTVIQEAITPGELEDILSDLPYEYRELFGKKPESPLSPSV